MNMEEELILTLNDNMSVKVLSELDFENKHYYFCVRLDQDEKETENYEIFEYIALNDSEKLIKVTDQSLIEQLLVLFTGQYTNYVDEVSK